MQKSTWDHPYAMYSWGSLLFALASAIFFFAAYGGTSWWVKYYPRPDGLIAIEPLSMGLFRMCIRGDCAIDLTNRLLVAKYVPQGNLTANIILIQILLNFFYLQNINKCR